jgi:hypothetical protein
VATSRKIWRALVQANVCILGRVVAIRSSPVLKSVTTTILRLRVEMRVTSHHPSDAARSTLQPVECPCAANTCCDQSFRSLVVDATEGIQVQIVAWLLDTWTEQTSGPSIIVVELPAVSAVGGWYTGMHRWPLSVEEL